MGIAEHRAGRYRHANPIQLIVALLAMITAVGCMPRMETVGPERMDRVSMDSVREWMESLVPAGPVRYDLRWTYQTQRGAMRGQAALRIQPPDSLRFDYRAPFGRSGAMFLVDEDVVWAEPEEDLSAMVQAVPLFWAALGIPREPPADTEVYGTASGGSRRWLYGVDGDTLRYYVGMTPPLRFLASLSHFGDLVGLAEVQYDEQTRQPTRATMRFPRSASAFVFDVSSIDSTVSFTSDVWERP